MQESEGLRKNAENCAEKAETAATPQARERFTRMEAEWDNLEDDQTRIESD